MPRRKRKSEDFKRDVDVRRGKSEVRDDVFKDILENSYHEQCTKIHNWIHTEILDAEALIKGLEELAIDNVSRATIDSARSTLHEIRKTFDSSFLTGSQSSSTEEIEEEIRPLEVRLEKAFNELHLVACRLVADLMRMRRQLNQIYDGTP